MALKDWKKVEDDTSKGGSHHGTTNATYTRWESKNDFISVWGLTTGKINLNKRATKNNIGVIWKVKNHKFKTKKQALAYAKAYMKKH